MKTYDSTQPLYSIHVPKCAGLSFSKVLRTWFGNNLLLHYQDERQNRIPVKHKLTTGFFRKKTRPGICIHGHFNNTRQQGLRDYYPDARQIITILRDPFDLHISTFFYIQREAKCRSGGSFREGKIHPIIENNWNLDDYLMHSRNSHISYFLPTGLTIDNYEQKLDGLFLYIGIAEQLQKSVDLLAKILGLPSTSVPQQNASEWTEKIPDGARQDFEQNNPLEMAIYEYAKRNWGNNLP